MRDAVARLDAEADERLGEPRHLARQLRERSSRRVAVLAAADGGDRVRASAAAQRWTQLRAMLSRPPTNHVAHSGPRETSSTRPTGCENSSPRSSTHRPPEAIGLVDRDAVELGVIASQPRPGASRVTFARSSCSRGVGDQANLTCRR